MSGDHDPNQFYLGVGVSFLVCGTEGFQVLGGRNGSQGKQCPTRHALPLVSRDFQYGAQSGCPGSLVSKVKGQSLASELRAVSLPWDFFGI